MAAEGPTLREKLRALYKENTFPASREGSCWCDALMKYTLLTEGWRVPTTLLPLVFVLSSASYIYNLKCQRDPW